MKTNQIVVRFLEVTLQSQQSLISFTIDFDNLEISEDTLSSMPGIKRAVMEAIRIRAPGAITRGVKQTFKIRVPT